MSLGMERMGFRFQAGLENAALKFARKGYPRVAQGLLGAEQPLRNTLGRLPGVGPMFHFAAGGIGLETFKRIDSKALSDLTTLLPHLGRMMPKEFVRIPPRCFEEFTGELVHKLGRDLLREMTIDQFTSLGENVKYFTRGQIAGLGLVLLERTQVAEAAAFTATQRKCFNAEQILAIVKSGCLTDSNLDEKVAASFLELLKQLSSVLYLEALRLVHDQVHRLDR